MRSRLGVVTEEGLASLDIAFVSHDTAGGFGLKFVKEAGDAAEVVVKFGLADLKLGVFIEKFSEVIFSDLKDRGD